MNNTVTMKCNKSIKGEESNLYCSLSAAVIQWDFPQKLNNCYDNLQMIDSSKVTM